MLSISHSMSSIAKKPVTIYGHGKASHVFVAATLSLQR
jgi:hypothetical protein